MSAHAQAALKRLAAANKAVAEGALAEAAGIDPRGARAMLRQLAYRGLVKAERRGWWRITAPGRRALAAADPARRRPSVAARAWAALRKLKRATVPELVQVAAAPGDRGGATSQVRNFLAVLARAGYVKKLAARQGARGRGLGPGFATYLLTDDTGPLAPMWRGGHVTDGNTGRDRPLAPPRANYSAAARAGRKGHGDG